MKFQTKSKQQKCVLLFQHNISLFYFLLLKCALFKFKDSMNHKLSE